LVREHVSRDREVRVCDGDRSLPQGGLDPQAALPVVGTVVAHHRRLSGIERRDGVDARVELRGGSADELAEALDVKKLAVARVVDCGDQPLLVAHDDRAARGDVRQGAVTDVHRSQPSRVR
jgi:hypothetical protein